MLRMTKGKCLHCKYAFLFNNELLRDAYCPFCGLKLRATTHLLRLSGWRWFNVPVVNIYTRMYVKGFDRSIIKPLWKHSSVGS